MKHFIVGKIPFKKFEVNFIERDKNTETWSYRVEIFDHYFHGVMNLKDSEDLLEKVFSKIRHEIEEMIKVVRKGDE